MKPILFLNGEDYWDIIPLLKGRKNIIYKWVYRDKYATYRVVRDIRPNKFPNDFLN